MTHTTLSFESWLKAVAKEIKKSRKHQNLYIPTRVAREVYNIDIHETAGATLILRKLKPESNAEACKYLKGDFKRDFGDLVYYN